jgi:D-alanine-D-alanine ligase-like ATP-grasp enzyme
MRVPSPAARAADALAFYYQGRRGIEVLTGKGSGSSAARSSFYRTIWEQAAHATGCSIVRRGSSIMEIRRGDMRLRVLENYTSLDDPVTLRLAGDKKLVLGLLQEGGLCTPRYFACAPGEVKKARDFVVELGGPVVVKPARGTGAGAGITAGVTERQGLFRAMARAGARCDEVMVEQQIEGENYRLLYFDGELIDAVLRLPPTVTGDGRSSVKELVSLENQHRTRKGVGSHQPLVRRDWELKHTLRAQGLRPGSIPASGQTVRLKTVVSDNRHEDNVPATGRLSSGLVESGKQAAFLIGVRLAAIDVVTPDPSLPLAEAGGAIIEVNTTPGLHYHYPTPEGAVPAAEAILRGLTGAAS